jgi:ABC-type bacteriocin/lantibiotic exporter with double-glycine peptidase domain
MKKYCFFNRAVIVVIGLVIVSFSGFAFAQERFHTLEDEQYKTACGPIACFVALQTLGIETSLDETAQRCGWKQDEFLPLESLQTALKSYRGVDCQIAKLSPAELCQLLKDKETVVILAMRKSTDEIDHAVCAIDAEENDQVIHLIDYPELHRKKLIGEIAENWDGAALVVRMTPLYRTLSDFAFCFAPMIAVFILKNFCHPRLHPKNKTLYP